MVNIVKQSMKNWRYILAGFLIMVTNFVSFGQVKLCEEKISYNPIDKQLHQLRDSLKAFNVDTIIIYSHWIHTNGFNGYGKVQWILNGEVYLLRLAFNKGNSAIERNEILKLNSDSSILFFFENKLDTIKVNPVRQGFQMSHDGKHYIQVNWGKENCCYIMSNLLVHYNPDNKKVQLIKMFMNQETDNIIIDEVIIYDGNEKNEKR